MQSSNNEVKILVTGGAVGGAGAANKPVNRHPKSGFGSKKNSRGTIEHNERKSSSKQNGGTIEMSNDLLMSFGDNQKQKNNNGITMQ